ncbi:hypothetical protein BV898_08776 [Hypsibius exemplaris]|uniref:CCHC-type domain-containing protein n=1 Tax=Hypsibius exemplaris TaxID=2072580 RepID=A0A1W0WPH9_HYPEX|nr:hypothetical protein BV898_08776 [Hypsibius exemplaris]
MSVSEEELVQEIGESLKVFEMRKQLKKVKSVQKDDDEDESRDPQDQSIRPCPISPQVMPRRSLRRPATRDLSNDEDEDDQKSENIQALMNLLTGKSGTRLRRDRGQEGFEVPRQSRPPKELPTFRGDRGEDAVEFLMQFERVGSHHKWDDAEKLNYLFLALKGNAMDWHQSMSTRAIWTEMRQAFLKAFGKQWVDMSLDEKTTHRLAREEPYSYATRILRNLEHTHPGASEHDRVLQLMCQLPKNLKPHFVRRDPPKSVQEFTEDLQNAARIQCLHEESVLENGNLGLLHAILQNPALEYSSALVKRFQASGSSAAPVLAAYEGPSVARQMENTTKSANTDLQMKALADEIASLKVALQKQSDDARRNSMPAPGGNSQTNFRGKRPEARTCHHCKRVGHIEKDCYSKNGFPNRNPSRNSNRFSAPINFGQSFQQHQYPSPQYFAPTQYPNQLQPFQNQPYYVNSTPPLQPPFVSAAPPSQLALPASQYFTSAHQNVKKNVPPHQIPVQNTSPVQNVWTSSP